MNPSVVWYESVDAIHAAFVAGLEADIGESLDGAEWGGEDANGEAVPLTVAQMIDGYRSMGRWGFCDGERIHLWHADDIAADELAWLVGHELAHLWKADAPDIAARDEAGAELVGRIASTTYSLVSQRLA